MGIFEGISGGWSALGSIAAGLIGEEGQADTNQQNREINNAQMAFNAEEAQKTRDFQTEMRKTQYQTAIEDMQKAGINPMLAYQQGGAGTPAGATATAGSMHKMENTAQAGITGAMAAAQLANINAQTHVAEKTAEKIDSEIPQTQASTQQIIANKDTLVKQLQQMDFQMEELRSRASLQGQQQLTEIQKSQLVEAQKEVEKIRKDLLSSQITNTQADTKIKNVTQELLKYDIPGARNTANYQNKSGPSVISPALKDLGAIINGAGAMGRIGR